MLLAKWPGLRQHSQVAFLNTCTCMKLPNNTSSDSALNACAGLSYLWEQAKFDPVKRQLTCHISLKDPQTSQVHSQTALSR